MFDILRTSRASLALLRGSGTNPGTHLTSEPISLS
uniref:Uncharacterized protein n=1 Tax=Anguilla anguilla TaxID=7936 RepID=A0A0E9XLR0_ANGAN